MIIIVKTILAINCFFLGTTLPAIITIAYAPKIRSDVDSGVPGWCQRVPPSQFVMTALWGPPAGSGMPALLPLA